MNSLDALNRLIEGNQRFVDGQVGNLSNTAMDRVALVKGQNPFAIILGCSDSRVPVEIVFDQGLGDLFIVRVAGNIVAPHKLVVLNSRRNSLEHLWLSFWGTLIVVLLRQHSSSIRKGRECLRTLTSLWIEYGRVSKAHTRWVSAVMIN